MRIGHIKVLRLASALGGSKWMRSLTPKVYEGGDVLSYRMFDVVGLDERSDVDGEAWPPTHRLHGRYLPGWKHHAGAWTGPAWSAEQVPQEEQVEWGRWKYTTWKWRSGKWRTNSRRNCRVWKMQDWKMSCIFQSLQFLWNLSIIFRSCILSRPVECS